MKYMDERAFFSCVVRSGVHICWNVKDVYPCAIFPRDHDEAHDTLWKFYTVYTSLFFFMFIMSLYFILSGSMEHFEAKKFVML